MLMACIFSARAEEPLATHGLLVSKGGGRPSSGRDSAAKLLTWTFSKEIEDSGASFSMSLRGLRLMASAWPLVVAAFTLEMAPNASSDFRHGAESAHSRDPNRSESCQGTRTNISST